MVPVSKYIKGTTLVRNTYLPITEMKNSQGLLKRIEEEKNDNDKADIRFLRGNLETLRMDHDSFRTSAEREKKDIHQKMETLEVIHTTEFRILLNCPFSHSNSSKTTGQKNPLQVTSDLQRVFPPGHSCCDLTSFSIL